jgi:hypothetical protein
MKQVTYTVIDQDAPQITISTPVDGAQYSLGQTVAAAYGCIDGGSGVESCDGSVAAGAAIDTSTAGTHMFTVDATDHAGNTASASAMYRVLAGDVSASVTGGETITTDPGGVGASTDVPLQTRIVIPNGVAGTISVTPHDSHEPIVRLVQQASSAERSECTWHHDAVRGDVHRRRE